MQSAMQLYGASGMSDVWLVRDARVPFMAGLPVSRVLLAVDAADALEALALSLADAGIAVEAAATADACLRALARHPFDLLVIDLRLGTASGLALVRDLRERGLDTPFVLVAAQAAVSDVVEAMRLGARTVLETASAPDDVVEAILREMAAMRQRLPARAPAALGGAPARKWAGYVLAATDAPGDPRTLAAWSRAIGVSRSVLIESCARLNIVPRDARDLARVLRLIRRVDVPWDPEGTLDVADTRTLRALLERAGLADTPAHVRPTTMQFLRRQQFVPQDNAGVTALRELLES